MTVEPASVAACSTLRLSSQKTLPCRQKAIWCSEIRRQTECDDQQSTAPISNDTRCRAGSEDRGGKLNASGAQRLSLFDAGECDEQPRLCNASPNRGRKPQPGSGASTRSGSQSSSLRKVSCTPRGKNCFLSPLSFKPNTSNLDLFALVLLFCSKLLPKMALEREYRYPLSVSTWLEPSATDL
jgi:hypothetical protein